MCVNLSMDILTFPFWILILRISHLVLTGMSSDIGLELANISDISLLVLITGGYTGVGSELKSAEIFNLVKNTSCSLPQLPQGRSPHSQDGGLVCGGGGYNAATQKTCVKWSPASGTWTQSHTLRQPREDHDHVSWATASGVYLIGGQYSPRTSEKVKLDGSVEEGFGLRNDTK